ncbi:hypothetical protein, partial [Pseudomonas fluorescens]|uniref:hypothetical protein n=1 Tax=Pseudomonas fluorescens TaxID=294 RepID=UPI003CFF5CE4
GKWAFKTSVLSSLKAYAFKAVEQGVGGTESAPRTVTVTAAVKPAINEVWDNKGFLLGDTGTTSETPLMLYGTVAKGNNVDIHDGTIKLGAATITAPGQWEFKTLVLPRKTYEFIAVEQGVGGTRSATYTVTVDSGVIPQITKMTDNSGVSTISDGDIIPDGRVKMTVKITSGKQGKIVSAMVSDGPFSVDGVGEETRSITLGKGTHYIRVEEIPAGRASPVVTLTVT